MEFVSDYCVFDIETTGVSFENDDIIEIAAVRVRHNEIVSEYSSLIHTNKTIPDKIVDLTGITDEMVQYAPAPEIVIDEFIKFIGDDILIGHKAETFDMTFVAKYHNLNNSCIDTLNLARALLNLEHNSLADVCNYYGVINRNAHRALSDVIATNECYQKMKKGYAPEEIPAPLEKTKHVKIKYSEDTQALQTLRGLLLGVTCDNVLNESEVMAVKKWLDDNSRLSKHYPCNVAYSEIEKALTDGILDPSELIHLLNVFIALTDPVNSLENNCININFSGKLICLSGEFIHGSKPEITQLLNSLGATTTDKLPSKKVDILLMGSKGSKAWSNGTYGEKFKRAMELQEKGSAIEIISESDFYKKLECTKCVSN